MGRVYEDGIEVITANQILDDLIVDADIKSNANITQSKIADNLTTKGDILGFDTVDKRIAVGINDQILIADSAQALGLKWGSAGLFAKIIKSIDETITTDTTLSDDSELVVALSANKRYYFLLELFFITNAEPDFKYAVSVPSGTTNRVGSSFWGGGVFESTTIAVDTVSAPIVSNANQFVMSIHGYVITGGISGNLALQWAQNTSSATATTVKAGSTLLVFEV